MSLYFDRWYRVYELHIRLCYSKDVSNAWDHKNHINMSQKCHFWKLLGATRSPVARETGGSIRGAAFQLRRLKTKGKFNTLTRNKVTLISVSSRHCPHWENILVYQKILFSEVVNRLLAMRRRPLLSEPLQINHLHSYILQYQLQFLKALQHDTSGLLWENKGQAGPALHLLCKDL